jgi:NADPH-dependent 2,4-dienoyl-CoA reductase/sulfur reductase-like enzyme/rhodanese-related sulfurtransferase
MNTPPNPLRIVIIGGVAGGMSAATRARRMNEHASITVLERGGFVSFANCGLPYHIAGRIVSEDKLLVSTAEKIRARFNIEVRLHTDATRIDRAAKTVEIRDLATGRTDLLPYDKLILATGASPILPNFPLSGAPNVFTVRSMEDTRRMQAYLAEKAPKQAVIVGAGFIGLEMAEALHDRGLSVTVVEKADHALPPVDREMALDLERELRAHDITLITGTGLASLIADAPSGAGALTGSSRGASVLTGSSTSLVTSVTLEDARTLPADLVILSIGVRPNVGLARDAGLTLGATGAIAVDKYQRTSDPNIYAVGDAAEVLHGVTGKSARLPLAGPANKHGRLAGEHAAAGTAAAPTAQPVGTAIVQVFSLAVGITGLGEAAARAAGFDVDTAYISGNDHASYYPGAQPLRIKLIYDRSTGRVLGGQITGKAGGGGVDKRIDALATLLHFHGAIDDLADLDLAYAPQFGSAKDPLHMAAFVAQNQRRELTPSLHYRQTRGMDLLDVRTREEFQRGSLPGARHVPLDDLRGRLAELNCAHTTAVFCQAGLRGHVATRLLAQNGFHVHNIKGGYALAKDEILE